MSHKVTLTWQEPSSSDGATSFNIKRSGLSGGPYTTIGTSAFPVETFDDANVKAGDVWFYVTTAVNPTGESGPSNEVKATIPFLVPSAPTNLAAIAV